MSHTVNEPKDSALQSSALIVFSGGQDSTTCLYWAKQRFGQVTAISFNYGQRHVIELESARYIAKIANVPHHVIELPIFNQLGNNALTSATEISDEPQANGLPNTFVPGRNLFFLSYAAAWAYSRNILNIVTGVAQTDYSGYPDCRENTLQSLQKTLRLGMEADFELHTPLMHLTKAQTVKLALDSGAMPAIAFSHSCYNGEFPPCGNCAACELRASGFANAGIADPLVVRATTV